MLLTGFAYKGDMRVHACVREGGGCVRLGKLGWLTDWVAGGQYTNPYNLSPGSVCSLNGLRRANAGLAGGNQMMTIWMRTG